MADEPQILAPHRSAHPQKAAFLAAYCETGNVTQACRASGVGRRTHYDWLEQDPDYAAAFDDAKEQAVESLEAEARRRAVEGVDEPVFYQGVQCGVVRKYSDTLLIFLMKGADPQKYAQFDRPTATTLIQNNIQHVENNITLTIPPPKVIGTVPREPDA